MQGYPEQAAKDRGQKQLDEGGPALNPFQLEADQPLQRVGVRNAAVGHGKQKQPEIEIAQYEQEAQQREKEHVRKIIAAEGKESEHEVYLRRPGYRRANLAVNPRTSE